MGAQGDRITALTCHNHHKPHFSQNAPYRTGSRRSDASLKSPRHTARCHAAGRNSMPYQETYRRSAPLYSHTPARYSGVICPFPGIQLSRPFQFELRSFPIQFHHISPSYNFKLTSERQTLFNRKTLQKTVRLSPLSVFSFYFSMHTAYLISFSCHKLSGSCRLKSAVI